MTGPDLQLSEVEFRKLVHDLTSSLNYLGWIWRGAESMIKSTILQQKLYVLSSGCETSDDEFLTYRKGSLV